MAISTTTTLLLSLFLSSTLLCQSATESPEVLDNEGHPLSWGPSYFIYTWEPLNVGGATLAGKYPHIPASCPTKVAAAASNLDIGIPVMLRPKNEDAKTVRVRDPVYINFSMVDRCTMVGPWTIIEQGANDTLYLAPSNGVGSWFYVEKEPDSQYYYLEYCGGGMGMCVRVGVRREGGENFLVVGGEKLSFQFFKYVATRQVP